MDACIIGFPLFYLQTLFVAYGPSFKKGEIVDSFQSNELYNMMAGNIFKNWIQRFVRNRIKSSSFKSKFTK